MEKSLKIASVAEAVIFAVLFGFFSYFVVYRWMAGGYRFSAYLYNLILITTLLTFDELADQALAKIDFSTGFSRPKNVLLVLLFVMHLVSFKTGLYLFYIAMLIVSRISILAPYLVDRYDSSFIYSVEYGILLLIPLDKFIELLTRDGRRTSVIFSHIKSKLYPGGEDTE